MIADRTELIRVRVDQNGKEPKDQTKADTTTPAETTHTLPKTQENTAEMCIFPSPQPTPRSLPPQKPKGPKPPQQPSAYSTLCSAVSRIATQVGYVAEEEFLRIPSTRNVAIVGRRWKSPVMPAQDENGRQGSAAVETIHAEGVTADESIGLEERSETVKMIVRRELGVLSLEDVAEEWRRRAAGIAGSKGTMARECHH